MNTAACEKEAPSLSRDEAIAILDTPDEKLEALIDRARRVPDFEAQIPEQVQHVFRNALAPGRLLVGQQEQKIDVRSRCEQAAPIAAGRNDGHAFRVRRIGRPIDVDNGVIVDQPDQLVLKLAEPDSAPPPVAIDFKRRPRRLASDLHQTFEAFDDLGTRFDRRRAGVKMFRQLVTRRDPVEIGRRNEPGQRLFVQDFVFFSVSASAFNS